MLTLIEGSILFVVAYGKEVKVKECVNAAEGIGWVCLE